MSGKRFLLGVLLASAGGTLLMASLTGAVPLPWRAGAPAAEGSTVLAGGVFGPVGGPSGSPALAATPGLVSFQGLLTDTSGIPVLDATYSVRFSVWDAASGPTEVWNETQPTMAVADGLFSVLLGSVIPLTKTIFDGSERWLEVKVESDPPMTPRQRFATVPYAFFAEEAGLLDGLNAGDFWKLGGNAGTTPGTDFLGTTDNQDLELHVNGTRVLRLEANSSPNIIGGFNGNSVTSGAVGATISGGGDTGLTNRVTDDFGTVGGGQNNQAGDAGGTTFDRVYATVSGGVNNTASGNRSTVSGGQSNTASSLYAVIGGGVFNVASGQYASVGGGEDNDATANYATVNGGRLNVASNFYAAVGGGDSNTVSANYGTIAGGGRSNPADAATANRVTDDYGTVGGGGNNQAGDNAGTTADAFYATVGGGQSNTASGVAATVAGGAGNTASDDWAAISGGVTNTASGLIAMVAGGQDNTASDIRATIGGGFGNTVSAQQGTISGGGRSVPLDAATGNRVTDDYGTVGGGGNNQAGDALGTTADRTYATVGGGHSNTASGPIATVGGGALNTASSDAATVGGGCCNTASGIRATVSGGSDNSASGERAVVGGGDFNTASGVRAAVSGGSFNLASVAGATIGGGGFNAASGLWATVPGGNSNTAAGTYSFAAGRRAKANHGGAFLFADANDFDFNSAGDNEFAVRATGGARFVSAIDGTGTPTAGVTLASGGTSWGVISDRSVKANFAPVDGRDILERLADIPVETWNLKSQDASIRHIGPMAQDFYAAFAVGEDDKHITTLDADGVALAAIQGLYELVQEQQAQIAVLQGAAGANGAGTDGAASGSSSSGLPATWLLLGGLLALGLALVSGLLLVALRTGRGRGAQA